MAKRGAKLTEINWVEFDKLCALQATLLEIATWFRCSEDTIQRAVEREHNVNFAVYFEQKSSAGKISLRRAMFQKALEGNATMLIWLSKNWLGFSDKTEDITYKKTIEEIERARGLSHEQKVQQLEEVLTTLKALPVKK